MRWPNQVLRHASRNPQKLAAPSPPGRRQSNSVTTAIHILSTEKGTRGFRLLALVMVSIIILFREEEVNLVPASILVVSFIIYTLFLGQALSKIPTDIHQRAVLVYILTMTAVDIALVLTLVHFAGGVENFALLLVPLFILYHTTYAGYTSGLFSATFAAVSYVLLAQFEDAAEGNEARLLGQVVLFYLLAGLGGYMANRAAVEPQLMEPQLREMLQDLIVATGQAHGVAVDSPVVDSKSCYLSGEAASQGAVMRYTDALRKIPQLSSVDLARTGVAEKGKSVGMTIAFTIRAQIK